MTLLKFGLKNSSIKPDPGKNNSQSDINITSFGPNPVTNGFLTIELFTLFDDNIWLSLYDLEGKSLKKTGLITKTNKNERLNLDIQNLPSGVYLLTISSVKTGESLNRKVIVNKQSFC